MRLKYIIIKIKGERFAPADASRIRGYIGTKFPEYIDLHHHLPNNRLLYKYPLIQYKVINNIPYFIGIKEGVNILKEIMFNIKELNINNININIYEKEITENEIEFGLSKDLIEYKINTPWIALNQSNYNRYIELNTKEREELLIRILIGNILSISKTLKYTATETITATLKLREKGTKFKGNSLIGFIGEFAVNFSLPDYIGIGKSVSRGFGAIIRKK